MFKAGIFSGQTALVTGGGSGIGLVITRQLLQYGAEVYIASRKQARLEKAAEQLSTYTAPATLLRWTFGSPSK